MALLVSIILRLIAGWLAFVVGFVIGWPWKPRWASSSSDNRKVKLQCSAPRSFDLSSPLSSSPPSVSSPLKGFRLAPCLKALVCETWTVALRQQKTVSPVSSSSSSSSSDCSEHVDVIAGGKQTEERLPNTVTELDLRHLVHLVQLVERKDGGHAWIQIMDRFTPVMRYQAWLREPKNGPTEYKSRTVFEDATPEILRDFFWDDEFRQVLSSLAPKDIEPQVEAFYNDHLTNSDVLGFGGQEGYALEVTKARFVLSETGSNGTNELQHQSITCGETGDSFLGTSSLMDLIEQYNSEKLHFESVSTKHGEALTAFTGSYKQLESFRNRAHSLRKQLFEVEKQVKLYEAETSDFATSLQEVCGEMVKAQRKMVETAGIVAKEVKVHKQRDFAAP